MTIDEIMHMLDPELQHQLDEIIRTERDPAARRALICNRGDILAQLREHTRRVNEQVLAERQRGLVH